LELRAAALRFTPGETAEFLNQVMGLNLSAAEVETLESRTEGWVAGLQLAALSLQGRDTEDMPDLIAAFSGSHRYILDYLAEAVLQRQPEHIQNFLLQTSILDRLWVTVRRGERGSVGAQGAEVKALSDAPPSCSSPPWSSLLEHLERANLSSPTTSAAVIVINLFADLLRSLLQRRVRPAMGAQTGGGLA
jgi:hypothetical protein